MSRKHVSKEHPTFSAFIMLLCIGVYVGVLVWAEVQ